jgi:hypothetical protein
MAFYLQDQILPMLVVQNIKGKTRGNKAKA